MSRIITALDFFDIAHAQQLVDRIDPKLTRLKVGNQLFTLGGPQLIERWQQNGFEVFLDLKFHDIPNTVASAVQAACDLGVWMVNVHASGGPAMLQAASNAVQSARTSSAADTLLIAVTVLTSMDATQLNSVGLHKEPAEHVRQLTRLAIDAGLDGVVCSAQEISLVRELAGPRFLTVTPGIRPTVSQAFSQVDVTGFEGMPDDQRRTMDPISAVRLGGDYLVIGRPITQSDEPLRMLQELNTLLQGVTDTMNHQDS